MDTKKLEALLTAVELGSFTRAAEVLGYTQSGLTHMMNSLYWLHRSAAGPQRRPADPGRPADTAPGAGLPDLHRRPGARDIPYQHP